MKFRKAISIGISALAVIIVALAIVNSADVTQENKIRVAFFPNVGHAVPIVGIEKLSGHEFEQTSGDSGGQRNLAYCSPLGLQRVELSN